MGVQRVVSPQQLKIATYEQDTALLGVDVPEPDKPEEERDNDSDDESDDSDDDFDGEVPPGKRRRTASSLNLKA